jgi:hypothetical protein
VYAEDPFVALFARHTPKAEAELAPRSRFIDFLLQLGRQNASRPFFKALIYGTICVNENNHTCGKKLSLRDVSKSFLRSVRG